MKKVEWSMLQHQRTRALKEIAYLVDEMHPLREMLGALAWYRHNWEYVPDGRLEDVIRAAAALDGVYWAIEQWARIYAPNLLTKIIAKWDEATREAK